MIESLAEVCGLIGAVSMMFVGLATLSDYLEEKEQDMRNRYNELSGKGKRWIADRLDELRQLIGVWIERLTRG